MCVAVTRLRRQRVRVAAKLGGRGGRGRGSRLSSDSERPGRPRWRGIGAPTGLRSQTAGSRPRRCSARAARTPDRHWRKALPLRWIYVLQNCFQERNNLLSFQYWWVCKLKCTWTNRVAQQAVSKVARPAATLILRAVGVRVTKKRVQHAADCGVNFPVVFRRLGFSCCCYNFWRLGAQSCLKFRSFTYITVTKFLLISLYFE